MKLEVLLRLDDSCKASPPCFRRIFRVFITSVAALLWGMGMTRAVSSMCRTLSVTDVLFAASTAHGHVVENTRTRTWRCHRLFLLLARARSHALLHDPALTVYHQPVPLQHNAHVGKSVALELFAFETILSEGRVAEGDTCGLSRGIVRNAICIFIV